MDAWCRDGAIESMFCNTTTYQLQLAILHVACSLSTEWTACRVHHQHEFLRTLKEMELLCPFLMSFVMFGACTTHGTPHSRETTAACDNMPRTPCYRQHITS